LLAVACLVLIALTCLSIVRKLERERRLLARLRARTELSLDELSEEDRDCARSLAAAGVVILRQNRCYLSAGQLPAFRGKRLRLVLSGGLGAALLAALVAVLILHH
jgi:hypothetical protein